MKTFDGFISDAAKQGSFNILFEAGMYSLGNDLENIVAALQAAGVPFEVVGGVAVNAHILAISRSRSFVTRDIDLLVSRDDLPRIQQAAEPLGYGAKKMLGGYTLIRPQQDLAESIHLLFVGEKSKSTQAFPHPALDPESKQLFGITIPVAPLKDLLQMKLNAMRPKDIIHIETLDDVGLITPAVERNLPVSLQEKLQQAREQIANGRPDQEG